ncbi:MAG: hypothetical protein LBV12_07120 [Puniceicoccales bacterium]|nr:hypothetical protein [Puniceicoccales bacterium]
MKKSTLRNLCFFCMLAAVACFGVACHSAQEASPTAGPAQAQVDSKASAAVHAAGVANDQNPDGPPKIATAGELVIAGTLLPTPNEKDRAEALERVNLALQGQLDAYARKLDVAARLSKDLKGTLDEERGKSSARIQELIVQLTQARLTTVSLIYAGVGSVLFALGAAAGVVSCFVSDVPKVATSLRIASGALGFFGSVGGSLPFWWDHPAFPWVGGILFAVGIGIGGWLFWQSWREAKANKNAVRESVATTVAESSLAKDTLTLLAGQIDKLKLTNPTAAQALTDLLKVTFDSDNETLIKDARAQALKAT